MEHPRVMSNSPLTVFTSETSQPNVICITQLQMLSNELNQASTCSDIMNFCEGGLEDPWLVSVDLYYLRSKFPLLLPNDAVRHGVYNTTYLERRGREKHHPEELLRKIAIMRKQRGEVIARLCSGPFSMESTVIVRSI